MKKVTIIIVMLAFFAIPASAVEFTMNVAGVINSVKIYGGFTLDGSVNLGSEMIGTCIYDSDTPDQDPSEHHGSYPVISLSMTTGNYTFTHDSTSLEPALFDIFTVDYCYRIKSSWARFDGTVYLDGSPQTYESITWSETYIEPVDLRSSRNEYSLSDALPESLPPFSTFDWEKSFELLFRNSEGSYFCIEGEITSITLIPEPATILLLALGSLALVQRHRRPIRPGQ